MEKIKVAKVSLGERLEFVEINGEETLEGLQGLVKGRIEIPYICKKLTDMYIDVIINDEGLINSLPIGLVLAKDGDVHALHGTVVFAGTDGLGETISLNDEQIKYLVENIKYGEYTITNEKTGKLYDANSLRIF